MFGFIWDLFQDGDIQRLRSHVARQETEAKTQVDTMRRQADSLQSRLLELERRHERLKLTTLALWKLLKDRVGLSEAELRRYAASTDLMDGELDGKADLTRELVECPRCARHLLNTAIVCPHCGAHNTREDPFEGA
jgi:hypothetical protein